jgi:hypothetical protein
MMQLYRAFLQARDVEFPASRLNLPNTSAPRSGWISSPACKPAFVRSASACRSCAVTKGLFKLTWFKAKYKVVRLRVENRKGETIKTSVQKDVIELVLADGKLVEGTFNLKAHDGPVWGSLDDEMRNVLAYPLFIRAAKAREESPAREEVVYFFAFFPADKVPDVPRSFCYTIESLRKTITLEPWAVAKN